MEYGLYLKQPRFTHSRAYKTGKYMYIVNSDNTVCLFICMTFHPNSKKHLMQFHTYFITWRNCLPNILHFQYFMMHIVIPIRIRNRWTDFIVGFQNLYNISFLDYEPVLFATSCQNDHLILKQKL